MWKATGHTALTPHNLQDEELISLFNDETDGGNSVAAVRVVRDQATNLGKGFAYILFSSQQAARMALAKDGAPLRKRPMRVKTVSSQAGIKGSTPHSSKQSSLGRLKLTGALGKVYL